MNDRKQAAIDSMRGVAPQFMHDCDRCVFLGSDTIQPNGSPADMYVCPSRHSHHPGYGYSILARVSSEPSDYHSGIVFLRASTMRAAIKACDMGIIHPYALMDELIEVLSLSQATLSVGFTEQDEVDIEREVKARIGHPNMGWVEHMARKWLGAANSEDEVDEAIEAGIRAAYSDEPMKRYHFTDPTDPECPGVCINLDGEMWQ